MEDVSILYEQIHMLEGRIAELEDKYLGYRMNLNQRDRRQTIGEIVPQTLTHLFWQISNIDRRLLMVRYYPCTEIEREYCGNTYIEHLSTYDSLFTRDEAFNVIKVWSTQFKVVRSFIQKYTDDDNDPEVEEIPLNSLSYIGD